MRLDIPPLYGGHTAVIAWSTRDPENPDDWYLLERRLDATFPTHENPATFAQRDSLARPWSMWERFRLPWAALDDMPHRSLVYEGEQRTYDDLIPAGTRTVQYRLTAGSESVTSALCAVAAKAQLYLSGPQGDLGRKAEGFSLLYTVCHDDTRATAQATATLDGVQIYHRNGLSLPATCDVAVSDALLNGFGNGTLHRLTITLTDPWGETLSRQCSFVRVHPLFLQSTFYLLRDGVPVDKAMGAERFLDYGAAGRHRYRIRAVDPAGRFCDSNEVEVETTLAYATLSDARHARQYIALRYRIGEAPQQAQSLTAPRKHYYFEGRSFAAAEDRAERRETWRIAFSLPTREAFQEIRTLFDSGVPALYRDSFGTCVVVSLDTLSSQYFDGHVDFTLEMTRLSHKEEISYD